MAFLLIVQDSDVEFEGPLPGEYLLLTWVKLVSREHDFLTFPIPNHSIPKHPCISGIMIIRNRK